MHWSYIPFLEDGKNKILTSQLQPENQQVLPPVGIIYLCCNDLDRDALIGISKLNYKGTLRAIVHDDSTDPKSQSEVNSVVNTLRQIRSDIDISLLRRSIKGGGKAGVMNYVLDTTGSGYEYFIMCDNDSMILQPDTIQTALKYLSDDNIAIAQFRIKGIDSDEYCKVSRYLKNCIDAFHVFMSVFSRYGWSPFIGHNAMLRTKAILEQGGFTPGFFSDDLDMTIRLNLKGLKVVYASDIVMGEKHPSSYASLPNSEKLEIKGKDIYLDGNKFIIRGIQYSPWRSGTGPNKNYPYPAPNLITQDLTLISKMHVNTILVYDAPAFVLDLAKKDNLFVIYTFSIYWNALGTKDFRNEKEKILNKVKLLKDQPNILAWELGNEIPIELTQKVSQDTIEKEMKDLYNSIKAIDPHHFISHGNRPPTKSLKLDFFDFQSFNVYPVWPPEVVAHGYGNYISEFLQPIAGSKPLLISEFGVNSLEGGEAGQARIVEQCWKELNEAKACGGVVFSFADEWWKNYNNPIKPDQWWYRVDAPNDELKHDLDPEEYYGVMNADRTPKLAYFAVQKMFEKTSSNTEKEIPAIFVGALFLFALGLWLWSRKKSK
jgi:hypothetical protein